jgi:hypothetical protein
MALFKKVKRINAKMRTIIIAPAVKAFLALESSSLLLLDLVNELTIAI